MIIEAAALRVCAGTKSILDEVAVTLASGETVALVGPNGAGKSTLVRVLAGALRPQCGIVRLRGREIAEYSPPVLARHRAVLSQSITVTFTFTVAEIVRMGAGDAHGRRVEALADAALAEVDLFDFRDRVFLTLSGGEQQRAHYARVLVQLACGEAAHGPGVLLLDEPTASLDLRHQIELAASVRRRAANGTAVIAVLHDLNLATLFADRIVVMDQGRIVADGPPADTIKDAMLERVFKVTDAVGRIPAGKPFVLPQGASPAA